MPNIIRVQEKNLVLKLSNNVNRNIWDESKYYDFIDNLTNGRNYQKEAILKCLQFMCSEEYQNILDLIEENYNENQSMKDAFGSFNNLKNMVKFPNSFASSIDLATGSGKSWVIYALAAIMLAEKKVDQVLILVPSVTIEYELTEKFKKFVRDSNLNETLNCPPPKIVNGSESIVKGCVCIENRDAVYTNSLSSIYDSLNEKGNRTLLLCDEVHHVYYTDENEWLNFVQKINFKYIVGLSGTCYYNDNSYFNNVIFRYSLKQAIEERRAKSVEYIAESNIPLKDDDRWKVIVNSHEKIKQQLKYLPLTLIVTANVNSCNALAKKFKVFLMNNYNLNSSEVDEKVLIIHSKPDAAADRIRLKKVDSEASKVEWIFSVSMLTEGWDVKRVFQIVPHEERAFNSKLLIAQVLGRGLRIPNNWDFQNMGNPKVVVFNHSNWANSVKRLVDEVLEIEKKLSSKIIEDSDYNFEIINMTYKPEKTILNTKHEGTYKLFEKGYIILPTDKEDEEIVADFVDISSNNTRTWSTSIKHKTYSIEDIAESMWSRFEDIPDDNEENLCEKYQKEWPISRLKDIISLSLQKSGNTVITEKLKQKCLAAIGIVFRQGNSVVGYVSEPDEAQIISTKNLKSMSVSASSLSKDKVLFWSSKTKKYLKEEEQEFFEEVIDTTNAYKQKEIRNIYDFKTPQSFVVADSEPEKIFINKLTSSTNNKLTKWIKSNSSNFYSFEYSWRKGEHPQRGSFNPDFFIEYDNKILVVEIKSDDQLSSPDVENMAKFKAAQQHFANINKYCKEEKYKFTIMTPKSFDVFFKFINDGDTNSILKFVSDLDSIIIDELN